MKRTIPLSLFLLGCLILFTTGCPEDLRIGPATLERAWGYYEEAFQSSNPDSMIRLAKLEFEDVIAEEPSNAEAYNGLGWCYGLQCSLSTAISHFNTSIQYDNSLDDPHAGLALAYSDLPNHQNAVDEATTLIQMDPLYQFAHISSPDDITVDDIRLVKAKSLCCLGNFTSALAEVQILNSSFNCDVSTPEGREALLVEIERLRGTV
jgi:tetratricopeptide (TPR) repeat protein